MGLNLVAGAEPIAGYTLVRPLGRGGFGEVWEATAPGGVRVALKFVRLDTNEAGSEQRALEIIRDIRHPHLLDVQFAARVEDCLVIAMPLCDRNLMDRLRECRGQGWPGVPRDELLGYMDDLARAVDFLNEPHPRGTGPQGRAGVQHRDIKPHNIFLVGGSVRLADFGLAKVLEASRASHTGAMSHHYVAPEAIDGQVSSRSDQYSLAVTYVQLRTGALPFVGDSVHRVLYGHLHEPPDLTRLPGEERSAIARALAKRPEERWPTCRALVLGLQAAAVAEDGRLAPLAGSTLSTATAYPMPTTDRVTTLPKTEPDTHSRRPIGRAVLMALAAALVGVAAWVLVARQSGPKPEPTAIARATPSPKARAETSTPPTAGEDETKKPETKARAEAEAVPSDPPAPGEATPRPVALETPARLDTTTTTPPSDPDLARQAHAILKQHCYGCHGSRFEVPGYNVLDRDNLVAVPAAGRKRKAAYVVPGQPDASLLWKRVGVEEDMPPEEPLPTEAEKALLKRWIEAGAPFPVLDQPRDTVSEKDVLTAIHTHLEQTPDVDRRHQRYFTLHNLHNNRRVLDDDLRLYRAALAKLVNSLSWKPTIVVPRVLPKTNDTVYVVDLRDVGWDSNDLWQAIIRREEPPEGTTYQGARDEQRKGYPYGLTHTRLPLDEPTQRVAQDVERLAGSALPYVRADWFIATASRPPLYEVILGLPKDAKELERRLEVDVQANFLRDRLARAGFATSGVSHHNRMVERHEASHGSYWKSYDFKSDEGLGELPRYPLGPAFEANPFGRQAFEHAGGEIIFNLPNRLHAYLLVNTKDERIEAGPIEIVNDALQTAGSATIVNGLSCMGCHKQGMISGFADAIRTGHAVSGEARRKVERLYPEKAAMDRLLEDDQEVYLTAMEKAVGSFLKVGSDRDKPIGDFPEPIGAIARLYVKDLGLDEAAAELGMEPKALRDRIAADPSLRRLGLGPLAQPGGKIKRAAWESLQFFNSPFQDAALQLELGTPYHEL